MEELDFQSFISRKIDMIPGEKWKAKLCNFKKDYLHNGAYFVFVEGENVCKYLIRFFQV